MEYALESAASDHGPSICSHSLRTFGRIQFTLPFRVCFFNPPPLKRQRGQMCQPWSMQMEEVIYLIAPLVDWTTFSLHRQVSVIIVRGWVWWVPEGKRLFFKYVGARTRRNGWTRYPWKGIGGKLERHEKISSTSDVQLEILNYGIKSKSAQSLPRNRSVNLYAILVWRRLTNHRFIRFSTEWLIIVHDYQGLHQFINYVVNLISRRRDRVIGKNY